VGGTLLRAEASLAAGLASPGLASPGLAATALLLLLLGPGEAGGGVCRAALCPLAADVGRMTKKGRSGTVSPLEVGRSCRSSPSRCTL